MYCLLAYTFLLAVLLRHVVQRIFIYFKFSKVKKK